MSRLALSPVLALASVAFLSTTGAAARQSTRLNGDLAQPGAKDVTAQQLSLDGAWVAFLADADQDQVFELYGAPSDASSAALRLSAPLPLNGDVFEFVVGASRAAYRADQVADEVIEVFSVPLDGSAAPVKLNLPLPPLGDVTGLWITPDGADVLFAVNEPYSALQRLYRAPLDASAPAVAIADSGITLTFGSTVIETVTVTSDSKYAVFTARTFDDEYEPARLLQVRVDGSQAQVDLSVPSGTRTVGSFVVSQDGSRVAYSEGIGSDNKLYAVRMDGTLRTQLNPPNTLATSIRIAPDGSRVVYVRGSGQAADLFSVASDGTLPVQLDPPATVPSAPEVTPDGARVVFVAGEDLVSVPIGGGSAAQLAGPGASADFVIGADSASVYAVVASASFRGLYRVPTAGGSPPVLLNGPPAAYRGLAPSGQKLVLTSTRAVYRAERGRDEVFELFSVPLDGSQAEVRISAALSGGEDVQSFLAAPNGAFATYLADQAFDETSELFRAPLDGSSAPLRYHAPFPGGAVLGDVLAFDAGPDEERVVFRADQDSDEIFELYSARRDGRGVVKRISNTLSFFSDVLPGFTRSASGAHVVYGTNGFDVHGFLFAARGDGAGDPVVLDSDLYALPAPYRITPDETRVVYRKELFFGSRYGLFTHALDGSGQAVHLNPGAIQESSVQDDLQVTADGLRAVYRADQDVNASFELFSVPLDGGAAPVQLNAPLAPNGSVLDFALTSDGERVVYLAGQAVATRQELFVVPVTGARPPLRLHPALTDARDVRDYRVSADGRRVVLRGDLVVDQQDELFSASILGPFPHVAGPSGAARDGFVRLTPLAAGQDAQADFVLHPDGQQVFVRVGPPTGAMDLYRVPLDGSSPPVRVNPPLVAGGRVMDFALSPAGAHAVYRADQRANEVFELFSAPLAGGPVVALAVMPATGDVSSFRIAPDSSAVIYLADPNGDEVFELFDVPLDGSAAPRRLNNPLASGGDVQSDYQALTGGRALFRADQETDNVFELFIAGHGHGPRIP